MILLEQTPVGSLARNLAVEVAALVDVEEEHRLRPSTLLHSFVRS